MSETKKNLKEISIIETKKLEKGNEKTTVVRIRRKGGIIVQDCDIYIGRRQTMGE